MSIRSELSYKYLSGKGLEIGGLHCPLELPEACTSVTYVDRMSLEQLKVHMADVPVRDLAIIEDDAELLFKFQDISQDFVIANHVFEHCQDPILTMKNWLRVLKTGGRIYAAIPNKDHTFDLYRDLTPLWHVILDHKKGPEVSRIFHHFETHAAWSKFNNKGLTIEKIWSTTMDSYGANANLHFHVWDEKGLDELMAYLSETLPLKILEKKVNGGEIIFILEKL